MKMTVPVEIVEKILLKSDGKTLKNATLVCETWKQVVNYLSHKTKIWKWCCEEEIPKKELVEYLSEYSTSDKERWKKIYDNWVSWQNIGEKIVFSVIASPREIPRISRIAVSGNFIAVGSEDGRVRVFNENWNMIYHSRHKAVKVCRITFIGSENDDELCIVIAYPRALVIDYFQKSGNPTILEDITNHSIFQNYICYEKVRGQISIVKLSFNGDTKILVEIWFSRIYSPNYPTCLNLWNGVCTVVINREVQIVHYDSADTSLMSRLEKVVKLNPTISLENTYVVLRDDIIISLGRGDHIRSEFIEFFILGSNHECSNKLFNSWEVLRSFITCIFVYGNTLVLGVDCGTVYFYHVANWKNFNIRDYQKSIILGRHPIISIDVREIEGQRKFFVASSFCIHQIEGYHV